jgi:hypothetical protein
MDENHGVRVKRSRVADLGQVVREIALYLQNLSQMYKGLCSLRRITNV